MSDTLPKWMRGKLPSGDDEAFHVWFMQQSKVDLRGPESMAAAGFFAGLAFARAALPVPLQGWQPISSAPKDGTDILLAVIDPETNYIGHVERGHFELVEEDEEDGPWDMRDGEPWCSYEGRPAGLYWCYWYSPTDYESRGARILDDVDQKYTHWQPLPAAPEAAPTAQLMKAAP